MRTSCSGCSSACTPRPNSRAPASVSRRCGASSPGTAAGSGPREPSIGEPPSTSHCDGPLGGRGGRVNAGKILLVEDNPDDIALTMRALKSHNMTNDVVVAQDGVQALDYLFGAEGGAGPDELPAVGLLDLKLPKVNGLEGLPRIRADARTRLLPVVILTSSDEERDLIDGYRLGAHTYVREPGGFVGFTQAAQELALEWVLTDR